MYGDEALNKWHVGGQKTRNLTVSKKRKCRWTFREKKISQSQYIREQL
jgi:hypothetical protein